MARNDRGTAADPGSGGDRSSRSAAATHLAAVGTDEAQPARAGNLDRATPQGRARNARRAVAAICRIARAHPADRDTSGRKIAPGDGREVPTTAGAHRLTH